MLIRNFDKRTDQDAVRQCVIELQDFERKFDPRMPPGVEIADKYIAHMLDRCEFCSGKVLVVETHGEVAGYATVLTRVKSEGIEEGNVEYGLVSDLVVMQRFRRQGLGRRLVEAAEAYAKSERTQYLRIGALAGNQSAQALYASLGYSNLYVELEKDLRHPV